jgi:hypothetical protein
MRGRVSLLRLLQTTVALGISRKQIRINVPCHALHQTLLQRPGRLETKELFAHGNRSCVERGTQALAHGIFGWILANKNAANSVQRKSNPGTTHAKNY